MFLFHHLTKMNSDFSNGFKLWLSDYWMLYNTTHYCVAGLQNSLILSHQYLVNFKWSVFISFFFHIVFSYVSWHNFSFCLANKMFDVRCIVWYCVISKVICFYFVLLFISYFHMLPRHNFSFCLVIKMFDVRCMTTK